MPNIIKPTEFTKDENASNWITLYEYTAELNEWTEKPKLLYVPNCFSADVRSWAIETTISCDNSWMNFKNAFLNKFTKKKSVVAIAAELNAIKMKHTESYAAYIERFKRLYNASYNKEQERRTSSCSYTLRASSSKFPTESSPTFTSRKEEKEPENIQTDQYAHLSDEQDIIIPEMAFIRYFIKGLGSEAIIFAMRDKNPTTLENAFETLRLLKEPDEDYDFQQVSTERAGDDLSQQIVELKKMVNQLQLLQLL
ncbi:unnamed protein product [Mucor hiemalis]